VSHWHFIFRRNGLTTDEKAVLAAVKSRQYADNPVILSHEQIAADASLARRTVVSLVRKLESSGFLRVQKRANGRKAANLYEVIQPQRELFERPAARPRSAEPVSIRGTEEAAGHSAGMPVDKVVENVVNFSRGAGGDVQTGHGPPGLMCKRTTSISGTSSETSNTKTRAEVRPREPANRQANEEARRKWEWRQAMRLERIEREDAVRRELAVGRGPQ